jgi:hypothetical protein
MEEILKKFKRVTKYIGLISFETKEGRRRVEGKGFGGLGFDKVNILEHHYIGRKSNIHIS